MCYGAPTLKGRPMFRRLLPLLLLLPAMAIGATPKIGMNLSATNYWVAPEPFIDHMKVSGTWIPQAGTATEPLTLTATGEPAKMPAGVTALYTMVKMDSPGATFDLLYDGTATFSIRGSQVLNAAPGKIAFKWDPAATSTTGQMQLVITSGTPSNIRIVRDDQLPLFQAGEIFQPDYLALLKGLYHVRVMDWMRTNGSQRTDVLLEWGGSYGVQPVPLSAIIALSNKTGARPWITLPAHISDAGISATFAYIDANLRADLKAIVEYSNEVWNTQFEQSKWAASQPTARSGTGGATAYFYGLQVARVAKLARGHRVGVVAMWQFVGLSRFVSDVYPGFKDGGALDSDLEAIGGANYLYGTLNNYTLPDGPKFMAANDIAGALANVAAQIPSDAATHAKWVAFAASHGWKNWTYEGGQYHLNTLYFGTNAEPLRLFYKTVQEDPRAAGNIKAELDAAGTAGVDAVTVYNLSTASTQDGYFGIINQPASWAVYQSAIAASAAPVIDETAVLQDLQARIKAIADVVDQILARRSR